MIKSFKLNSSISNRRNLLKLYSLVNVYAKNQKIQSVFRFNHSMSSYDRNKTELFKIVEMNISSIISWPAVIETKNGLYFWILRINFDENVYFQSISPVRYRFIELESFYDQKMGRFRNCPLKVERKNFEFFGTKFWALKFLRRFYEGFE
jgi:hypothetical protein